MGATQQLLVAGSRYIVKNSALFAASSSQKFTRTFGAGASTSKFTVSLWIKLNTASARQGMIGVDNPTNSDFEIQTDNTFQLFFNAGIAASVIANVTLTTGVWYHLMAAVDTAQATASNRVHLYKGVLGTQATEVSYSGTPTYPSLNYDFTTTGLFANAASNQIGDSGFPGPSNNYFDGLMAEYALVFGQQLTPSSFASGGYPISLAALSFGTQGHYLNFQNSGNLGLDSSGNSDDWTNVNAVTQSSTVPA